MDVSQLPESQRLALGTYTSVTNQPVEAAVPLLRRSEWNVQVYSALPAIFELYLIILTDSDS